MYLEITTSGTEHRQLRQRDKPRQISRGRRNHNGGINWCAIDLPGHASPELAGCMSEVCWSRSAPCDVPQVLWGTVQKVQLPSITSFLHSSVTSLTFLSTSGCTLCLNTSYFKKPNMFPQRKMDCLEVEESTQSQSNAVNKRSTALTHNYVVTTL